MPIETDEQFFRGLSDVLVTTETYFLPAEFKAAILGDDGTENIDIDRYGHSPWADPEVDQGYENSKYKRKPHNIWFYYMRVNTDGALFVREYIHNSDQPISNGQMKQMVRALALNARKPLTEQNPKPTGNNNFTKIEIDRVSYFVILVDEANWEFQKVNGKPVVLFKQTDPDGNPCRPNYSFFKAEAFKSNLGSGDNREALVMVNYLKKNAAGDELSNPPPDQDHKHRWFFDFPQRVRFALPNTTDENGTSVTVETEEPRMTVMIDPGGTNLGPPKDP
jgi:hypothetical protein